MTETEQPERPVPKPSIGRMVHYALTEDEADEINARRTDAVRSELVKRRPGHMAHVGNTVIEEQIVSMTITAVHDGEYVGHYRVNGQCTLDGNDTLWVEGADLGNEAGRWNWPERI